jgi:hypothetical protein
MSENTGGSTAIDAKNGIEERKFELEVKKHKLERNKAFAALIISPIVTALAGFYIGTTLERQKETSAEERLFLEYRMKVWVSAAASFPDYVSNWRRLRTIAGKADLSATEQERKNKYQRDRDAARGELFSALEQARQVFSSDVSKLIDDFEQFDTKHSAVELADLPAIEEWVRHERKILGALKGELRRP